MNSKQPLVLPQITSGEPFNRDIFNLVCDLVWESIEEDAKYRAAIDPFNVAVNKAAKQLGATDVSALENAPFRTAAVYGEAMFKLGLAIGRDPMTVLTLPAGNNQR